LRPKIFAVDFSKRLKDFYNNLIFNIKYSRNLFEREILDIRMSEERIHANVFRKFKKDFFSFSVKTKDDLFKYLFYILIIALMVALPILAAEVGVSEKEIGDHRQAELFYSHFSGASTEVEAGSCTQNHPHFVDFLCCCICKWFGISSVYQFRHIIGALFAWGILLVAGGFLMKLFTWRAAFFGTFLLFISPHFLAQSFGNVADVSFALFYLLGIYEIYLFVTEFPIVKWKRLIILVLDTIAAVYVCCAGFVLLHYFILMAFLIFFIENPIRKLFTRAYGRNFLKLVVIVSATVAAVYLADLMNPLHFLRFSNAGLSNAIVKSTENLAIGNFLWAGKSVSTSSLGVRFLLSRMQVTLPLVIIIGCLVHVLFIRTVVKEARFFPSLLLYFSLLFPLWSLHHAGASVGDGWFYYMMLYPLVAMMAAAGYDGFLRRVDDRYTNAVIVGGIFLLSLLPLRHVLLNQPGVGIYYNELAGGVHSTFGKYPIDEGKNYNRKASKWLLSYISKNDNRYRVDTLPKLQVATQDLEATRFFFRNDTGRIEVVAGSLSDTGLYWDYYLSYIDDMSPRELENCWNKPEAIIKTYKADSKPVAIILRTLPDTTGIPTDTLALDSIALSQNKVAN
jgi:hypothetical protein